MVAAIVQSAQGSTSKGTTITATLGSTPTVGNLLLAYTAISGVTAITSVLQGTDAYTELHDFDWGSPSHNLLMYGRIADGTEGTGCVALFASNVVGIMSVVEVAPHGTWLGIGSVEGLTRETDDPASTSLIHGSVGGTDASLHVGWFEQRSSSAVFSAPTNSYTIQEQIPTGSLSCVLTTKVYTPPSTSEGHQVTSDTSAVYGGLHTEFLEEPGGINLLRLRADGKY